MQNLFDKASLVMVPSGYDNGKLYNIKPEDKSSAFEFERATMATRVNSSGIVETMFPEATNLLLQSNQFDEGVWGKFNGSNVNPSVADPFGGNNAWELDFGATDDARLQQSVTLSPGTAYSFSVWARVTSGTKVVRINAASSLFNKTLTTSWQRIEANQVATNSSVGIGIRKSNSEGDYTVQIYGAQLETGYFATPYIDTTTQTVTRQNQANQPRIDYTSGEGALLLEPARTNEVVKSELISEANVVARVNFEDNSTLSPDGLNNATKIIPTTQNDSHLFSFSDFNSNIDGYTQSIYVKSNGYDYVYLVLNGGAYTPTIVGGIWFDIKNGVKGSATVPNSGYDIEAIGSDGWYRIYATHETNGTTTPAYLGVSEVDGVRNFAGDGTKGVYAWGMQLEQGSYPTSYIPTNGQQETRASENIEKRNLTSSLLNQSEGSFYLELQAVSTDAGRFVITSYPDGTSDDTIRFIFSSNIQFQLVSSGTQIVESTNPSTQRVKVIGTYSGSELKLCVNGGTVQKLSGNFSFANQPTRIFAHAFVDTIRFFGDVYGLHYFPETLTDEELQRLTSPSADATTFTELANNNGYTIL